MHHTDKETQADLELTSNLEESEFSYRGSAEFQEMQQAFDFTVQITPLKDSKKHRDKMVSSNEDSMQNTEFAISLYGSRAVKHQVYWYCWSMDPF